jgi:hypothetical protein
MNKEDRDQALCYARDYMAEQFVIVVGPAGEQLLARALLAAEEELATLKKEGRILRDAAAMTIEEISLQVEAVSNHRVGRALKSIVEWHDEQAEHWQGLTTVESEAFKAAHQHSAKAIREGKAKPKVSNV